MIRLGIVDIDTSHAWVMGNYANYSGRAKVVAITDSGTVWPTRQLERVAAGLGAEMVGTIQQMVERVDAALILGARYDLRLERARPLIEAGKSVWLDKPAAGNLEQIRLIQEYLNAGARIMGGSTLPYCPELTAVREVLSRGHPSNLVVIGSNEFFEHGIHAADIALNLGRSAPKRVQWSSFGPSQVVWAELENGLPVSLFLEAPGSGWAAIGMNGQETINRPLDLSYYRESHYARMLQAFFDMHETGQVAISLHWHLEAIKMLIAARRSRKEGRMLEIEELGESEGFNGKEYARTYRAAALKNFPDGAPLMEPKALLQKTSTANSAGASVMKRAMLRVRSGTKRMLGPQRAKRIKAGAKHLLGQQGTLLAKRVLARIG